jgi:localization factor PodJL
MKSAAAWNVKGVELDARDAAREAARRAGVSVGEWLNSVILDSADTPDRTADEEAGEDLSAIHQRLEALAKRLGNLRSAGLPGIGERRGADVESDLHGAQTRRAGVSRDLARSSEDVPPRIAEAIGQLKERLDKLIAGGSVAAGEFESSVRTPARGPDRLNARPSRAAFPSTRRVEATDDAISEITTRQRALDQASDRSRDEDLGPWADVPARGERTSELERHLRTLTRQIETIRRPCGFDESVAALRHDLGAIGDALTKAMPRCALDALENEVQTLADRAGHERHRYGDDAGMAAVERRLAKLHEALNAFTPAESVGALEAAVEALSRKIDMLASSGPDAAALQHLETAIAELRGLSGRIASGEALASLATEVRTLAERMDRFAASGGRNAISSLERRLEALSETINSRTAETGGAVSSRIEPLLTALSAQLERLDAGDQAALSHIEDEIAKLAQKINDSDARLGDIDAIERALADLFLQIEETRANTVEASEFKRDLADLRLTQTEAELRTQQTLEAVQDTLERLSNRLARMEGGIQAGPPQRPLAAPAGVAAPAGAATTAAAPSAPAKTPGAKAPVAKRADPPATPAVKQTATSPRAPLDPSLPGDRPLEPRAAGPGAGPSNPAERSGTQSERAPAAPSTAPEASDKASFIAAARRAAQVAAAEASPQGTKRTDERIASGPSAAGDMLDKMKRPLVMSVAAAILVVGGAHVTLTMLGPSGSARIEASRQASDMPPSGRESAKSANGPSQLASTGADTAAANASAAPILGPQLFAPRAVASTGGGTAAASATNAPAGAPRQEARTDAGTLNQRTADITGSVPKADGGTPTTPGANSAAASAADGLPAAIAGPSLRSAAAAGQAAAEYEIAMRYAEGRGVAQSLGEAARWLERAAAKGLAPAQYRLGSLYEKGNGVKKDLETARRLYIAAAEKGNARAMHNLAVLHAEGVDGKPEYKAAVQWFRKAASYGIADSQYNLGILYARGIGVEQNLAESYKWFALAAQQGDQDAGRKRDDVAARLDPQSLVAAKLAAQTFTAESQPEEATTVRPAGETWDRPAATTPAPAAKNKSASRRI